MSLTLSPQMKIVALVGVLLVLVLGAASMLLRRSASAPAVSATPTVAIRHFTPKAGTPAARLAARSHAKAPAAQPAKTAPTPHAVAPRKGTHVAPAVAPAQTATVAAQPAVKPVVAPKPKPAPKPPVAANGLPTPLDELLHTHRIVVVALYDPEVPSERTIALPEARAGALAAGAGFLAVNVLDERVAGPLTAVAGNGTILPDPGILVYRQPTSLVNTLSGFVDREGVAEAVANALTAPAPVTAPPPAATTAAPPVAPTAPTTP